VQFAEPGDGGPGDAELVAAVRAGATDAYGLLYRRHVGSARALARQLTGCPAERDDLVAEAFLKLFTVLRAGGGPDTAFRAYLLTVLRRIRYDRTHADRRVELSDDMGRYDPGVPWEDTAVAGLESRLAAGAFTRLPARWQVVLWHTEVEQESPAEVAPRLGLTPNGAAALAYRAREGLRQAYLQEHLADGTPGGHRETVGRLGAWARGGLTDRGRAQVDAHLATCPACRALAAELADVGGGLCRSVPG
jgi:RNA polymerase sigma factor (sigma-70 family)